MVRTLRPRGQKSYDVVAMQKKERYETRMLRNEIYAAKKRKKNAKAAAIRRAERKEVAAERRLAKKIPNDVVKQFKLLQDVSKLSHGDEFYYLPELNCVLEEFNYTTFNPFKFCLECNKILLHDINEYIDTDLDNLTLNFNHMVDEVVQASGNTFDDAFKKKLKTYKL